MVGFRTYTITIPSSGSFTRLEATGRYIGVIDAPTHDPSTVTLIRPHAESGDPLPAIENMEAATPFSFVSLWIEGRGDSGSITFVVHDDPCAGLILPRPSEDHPLLGMGAIYILDTMFTYGNSADGTTVNTWKDESGNGNNFTKTGTSTGDATLVHDAVSPGVHAISFPNNTYGMSPGTQLYPEINNTSETLQMLIVGRFPASTLISNQGGNTAGNFRLASGSSAGFLVVCNNIFEFEDTAENFSTGTRGTYCNFRADTNGVFNNFQDRTVTALNSLTNLGGQDAGNTHIGKDNAYTGLNGFGTGNAATAHIAFIAAFLNLFDIVDFFTPVEYIEDTYGIIWTP